MRANVGFTPSAIGRVRLRPSEGLTGLAVTNPGAVCVACAPEHERYVPFAELDEDRFPVFAAAPMLSDEQAFGAVVVQRACEPIAPGELGLLTMIAGMVGAAVQRAEFADSERATSGPRRRAGGGTRRVILKHGWQNVATIFNGWAMAPSGSS